MRVQLFFLSLGMSTKKEYRLIINGTPICTSPSESRIEAVRAAYKVLLNLDYRNTKEKLLEASFRSLVEYLGSDGRPTIYNFKDDETALNNCQCGSVELKMEVTERQPTKIGDLDKEVQESLKKKIADLIKEETGLVAVLEKHLDTRNGQVSWRISTKVE